MKLRLPALVVVTMVPATAANNSRRHPRTLSAGTKKPASLAGCFSLPPCISCLSALFLLAARRQSTLRLLNFFSQSPGSP